jgi:hypothetical protein
MIEGDHRVLISKPCDFPTKPSSDGSHGSDDVVTLVTVLVCSDVETVVQP